MSNIRSLNDLSSSMDDDEHTSSFAGGEKSGIAIQNPGGAQERIRSNENQAVMHIIVYRNGFKIKDMPFVPLSSEEMKTFMIELHRGEAPKQIKNDPRLRNSESVRVSVEEKPEDFAGIPSITASQIFSGTGHVLVPGSTTPSIDLKSCGNSIKIDESLPITTIQFRLSNGTKLSQRFNTSTTIGEIHQFIQSIIGKSLPYNILDGFPPVEITSDQSATLESSGLLQAVLTIAYGANTH